MNTMNIERSKEILDRAIKTKSELTKGIKELSPEEIRNIQILLQIVDLKTAVRYAEHCLKNKEVK